VGHYASKCPYEKEKNQSRGKENNKFNKMLKEKIFKKKSLCVEEDSSVFEYSSESPSEYGASEFILMVLENLEEEVNEYEEEGEADLEGEFINALEEIDRVKEKNKKLKDIFLKYVKEESNLKELVKLKVEL